ncbi:MAG: cation:proton antiporter [Candidatus Diapherotrites archaeon]|uniref:Cation:proton antiporter n=2 Tax=Candidatus Iainarchaeum sp. TaxID=3101447 RepID=A0A7J4JWW9_9ARCH|nr:MAG: monovalent cation:H+ antiporter-2, CPA2 family [archaeon GW2011_AR21]MBS3058705.1 cation:proton antiporter [Candidatus Diapherotrites archaeon]HIH21944.1 cation:proton antiporter [Candidatus Diapherotrites archaeon]
MAAEALLPLTLIGVVILLAIFLSIAAKKLGQNAVIGFILAGFILGPFGLRLLHPQDPLVIAFSELGLFILLFYLGLELSWKDFLEAGSSGFGLALLDMAASTIAGFLIAQFFGLSLLLSILIGFMLFSTSTAIVAKFVIDKGIIEKKSTKLALSILIMQDFIGILLVVLITSISMGKGAPLELALTSLVFAIVVFVAVSQLSRFIEQWILSNNLGQTEITLYALGIGLIVATLASMLSLSMALGAYFAGFALAETRAGGRIKRDVSFMRDFFLVFFFVGFGTTIFYNAGAITQALPSIETLASIGTIAALLAVAALLAHFFIFTIFGGLFGMSKEDSSLSAILLGPLGEFVVIIATAAILVVPASEKPIVPILAFLLIIITVFVFEPLYNIRRAYEKIASLIPSFSKREHAVVESHTSYSLQQLKSFAWNLFVILCLAWLTIVLYKQLPTFGFPLPYARQVNAIVIFLFFAIAPTVRALIALKNLVKHSRHKSLATV